MYVREDLLRATDLMADGAVPAGDLVTATLPLAEGAQAFTRAASGEEVKVHLVTS
jgi:threonine dehydrogenase-like Zn-dependent dehydrogenase